MTVLTLCWFRCVLIYTLTFSYTLPRAQTMINTIINIVLTVDEDNVFYTIDNFHYGRPNVLTSFTLENGNINKFILSLEKNYSS